MHVTALTERPEPEARPAGSAPAAAGDRFVATASLLLAAVLLGFQVLAGELIPMLLGFGLAFLVLGAALARRRRRWLLVAVVVLVAVHIAGGIPFLVANLAHPESPLSFLVEALGLLAGLTAAAGAVAGLRGVQPGARRPIALAAGCLAVVAVIVSAVTAAGLDADAPQVGDVTVAVAQARFPDRVEAPAGAATLWVDNQDPVRHTLVIEGAAVHAELPASTAVRVPADLDPGAYRFFCDVPGHERMAGELVVR